MAEGRPGPRFERARPDAAAPSAGPRAERPSRPPRDADAARPSRERAPGAEVRAAAARVVNAVVNQGRSLDDALAFAERRARLEPRDQSLLRALVYGVLRHYRRLGWQLTRMVPREPENPLVDALLRVGLFQILELRIPDYAATAATAAAASMLDAVPSRALVNAVMRRAATEPALLVSPEDPRTRHSWPDWMAETLIADWGGEAAAQIMESGSRQAPMTLRVNRRRMRAADYVARLASSRVGARLLDGVEDAVVLELPLDVERLPGFERGSVSVQDAAAQLAADLLDAGPGQRVLDACSAPGGKTAHLLERRPDLKLTAIDRDGVRLAQVDQTLRRVGASATLVGADATDPGRWWDGQPYDRILVDAPCSGTGVARRHPDIKWLRRADDIPPLAATQSALLDALWPLLAPGGRLVYATCSVLRAEGREVIEAFLARTPTARAEVLALPVGEADGPVWRIPPGGDWDGFQYVVLSHAE